MEISWTVHSTIMQGFVSLISNQEGVSTFTHEKVEYCVIVDQGVMFIRRSDMSKYPVSHVPPKRSTNVQDK